MEHPHKKPDRDFWVTDFKLEPDEDWTRYSTLIPILFGAFLGILMWIVVVVIAYNVL